MSNTNAPAVSRKSDFRIFMENGVVVVEDAEHKRGGNLLSNGGKWVAWRNDTGGICRLVFRVFLDESGSGEGQPAWPFDPDQQPWSNEHAIPKAFGIGSNPWRARLARVGALSCFEYKVKVRMDDGSSYELDPMIVVRP